jgi:hypothetical protein
MLDIPGSKVVLTLKTVVLNTYEYVYACKGFGRAEMKSNISNAKWKVEIIHVRFIFKSSLTLAPLCVPGRFSNIHDSTKRRGRLLTTPDLY